MEAGDPLYRLKLYGHVSGDLDRFTQKAAVILRMSRGDVEKRMLDLPVVLKENLGEDAAELLKLQLDAIGALTIIEPTEEKVEKALPTRPPQEAPFWDRLRELWSRGEAYPEARIYVVLLIAATVLLSSIITFGYSTSLVKLFRQDAQLLNHEPRPSSEKASRPGYDRNRMSPTELAEISSRIDGLDTRIKMLQDQYAQANRMLQQVNTSSSANRRELFERGREVADLRIKIRQAHSELMELRRIRQRSEG